MGLSSALFTGLSGLDVNQTRLNVVGNNIANVNTVAFKASRALFKPQFYVTDGAGSPPSAEFGGENPSQRGLGAVVATIQKDLSGGSIEPTGKDTDLALEGEGYFVVQGKQQEFTRDGSFVMNSANQLVTSSGEFVQGYGVDANGNVIAGSLQNVTVPLGSLTNAKATENVKLEGNLNADGDVASGASVLNSEDLVAKTGSSLSTTPANTLLTDVASASTPATALFTAGDVLTLNGEKGGRDIGAQTLTVTSSTTLADLATFFQQSVGVDTSVAGPPTPGVTVDSVNATTVHLTIAGNTGAENALSIPSSSFTNNSGVSPLSFSDGQTAGGILSDPAGESVATSFVAYDSLGTPLTVNLTAVLESQSTTGTTWRFYANSADDTDAGSGTGNGIVLGNGTLNFDNNGKLINATGAQIQIDRANTGATTPLSMTLDFDSMTALTSQHSDLVMSAQDGSSIGTLNNFSIGADGKITGGFTNGLTRTLGQVAVATFQNPEGLIDNGGNMFVTGAASGVPIISTPLTLGAGSIRSGALEMSNVDLSKEFINLIISSTGFSASSRVITTSDQLIQELLNTKR
jgi:flagellar hook protein FlgE